MRCEYYREKGYCSKGNHPTDKNDMGECVYVNGEITNKVGTHCSEGKKFLEIKSQIVKDIESQLKNSIIAKIKFPVNNTFKNYSEFANYLESKGFRIINEMCGICEVMAEHRFYGICGTIEDWEAMNVFNDRIDRWKILKDEGYKRTT